MKYAFLLLIGALTFDAAVMNGRYRNQVGHAVGQAASSIGHALWGGIS